MKAASAAPAFNWSGAYCGVNGGGAWGRQDPFSALTTNRFDAIDVDFSGGKVGGTAGVQLQVSWLLVEIRTALKYPDRRRRGRRRARRNQPTR